MKQTQNLLLSNDSIVPQDTVVCCQTATYELIHKVLTQEQRDVIATYPLQGLLQIGNVQIRRQTCKKIADTYNTEWNGFYIQNKLLQIQLEDVENLMGLPSEGDVPKLVEINTKVEIDCRRYRKQVELYKLYKDGDGAWITYAGLVRQIKQQKRSTDEHFIRRFCLCVICRLLCPTTKYRVSAKYLSLMLELEDIKKVNWAKLTLDHLMEGIQQYRSPKGRKNLFGNLPLLQVVPNNYLFCTEYSVCIY